MDKLLPVVGLYTSILSFLALATVLVSRQDAKEQLEKVNTLREETQEELKKTLQSTKEELQALKAQVRAEFPFISELQGRVLGLIQKLEAKYPEDENLNHPQADSWKREEQHQDVLIDELQIVAVSVVVLDKASLLKLYMVLSRSYFDQYRTGAQTDNDAARYNLADAARQKSDEFKGLMLQAKADLVQCTKLDPYNAGAVYNLALLFDLEGNREKAIGLSEGLLSPEGMKNVSRRGQEKYFADVYINLACYLADASKSGTDLKEREALWDRVVQVCRETKSHLETTLRSTRAVETFLKSLRRELGPGKDFSPLPEDRRELVHQLL